MTIWDEPPFEPRFAAMALVAQPDRVPGVEARPAATFDEFQAANRVAQDVFEMPEEVRQAADAQERTLWELESRHPEYRTYIALVDGEVAAGAAIIHGANAGFLAGGFTREDMRGRGIYRALVRARWDAAVQRGTPALTVGAGKMSRPILERLGFETVGWSDTLSDVF
jgi:GNAT superfamily N-acetyltransferase